MSLYISQLDENYLRNNAVTLKRLYLKNLEDLRSCIFFFPNFLLYNTAVVNLSSLEFRIILEISYTWYSSWRYSRFLRHTHTCDWLSIYYVNNISINMRKRNVPDRQNNFIYVMNEKRTKFCFNIFRLFHSHITQVLP